MKKKKILLIITFLTILITLTGCNESKKADTKKIDKPYISTRYMWKIWKKVYRSNFGSTRHLYMPGELDDAGDA